MNTAPIVTDSLCEAETPEDTLISIDLTDYFDDIDGDMSYMAYNINNLNSEVGSLDINGNSLTYIPDPTLSSYEFEPAITFSLQAEDPYGETSEENVDFTITIQAVQCIGIDAAQWYMFSLNLTMEDNIDLVDILDEYSDDILRVENENFDGIIYNNGIPEQPDGIGAYLPTEGYYMRTSDAVTLCFSGETPVLYDNDNGLTINLISGWNMISFPSRYFWDPVELFEELVYDDLIDFMWDLSNSPQSWTLLPNGEMAPNASFDMKPGVGYYIHTTDNTSITITEGNISRTVEQNRPLISRTQHFEPVSSTYSPMAIIVTSFLWDNNDLNPDDEIGIFDGNLCVGARILNAQDIVEINDPDINWSVNAYKDDTGTPDVDGFIENNTILIRVWKNDIGLDENFSIPGMSAYTDFLNNNNNFIGFGGTYVDVSVERPGPARSLSIDDYSPDYPNGAIDIKWQRPYATGGGSYGPNTQIDGNVTYHIYRDNISIGSVISDLSINIPYTDIDVEPNTQYVYTVLAENEVGVAGTDEDPDYSSSATAESPPDTPILEIDNAVTSQNQIKLDWPGDNHLGNQHQYVYYELNRIDTSQAGENQGNESIITLIHQSDLSMERTFTDTSLLNSTSYVYRIRAFVNTNPDEYSNPSNYSFSTATSSSSFLTNVQADSSQNSITLTWSADEAFNKYRIYDNWNIKYVENITGESIDIQPPLIPISFDNSTEYCFSVTGYNENNETQPEFVESYVKKVCTTTPPMPQPGKVVGVELAVNQNTITLSWEPECLGMYYRIYRMDENAELQYFNSSSSLENTAYNSILVESFGGDWLQYYSECNADTVSGIFTNNTFIDDNDGLGLSDYTNYCYSIQAVNFDIGNADFEYRLGEMSDLICVDTPAPDIAQVPTNISVTYQSPQDRIRVQWSGSDPISPPISYNIYRDDTYGRGMELIATTSSTVYYDNDNLIGETEYCYQVSTVNAFGETELSDLECTFVSTQIENYEPDTPVNLSFPEEDSMNAFNWSPYIYEDDPFEFEFDLYLPHKFYILEATIDDGGYILQADDVVAVYDGTLVVDELALLHSPNGSLEDIIKATADDPLEGITGFVDGNDVNFLIWINHENGGPQYSGRLYYTQAEYFDHSNGESLGDEMAFAQNGLCDVRLSAVSDTYSIYRNGEYLNSVNGETYSFTDNEPVCGESDSESNCYVVTANNLGGESFPTDPICTNGPNCAPVVNNTSIGVVQNSTNTIDLSASWISEDEEGDPLTFSVDDAVCCIISINESEVEFEYDVTQDGCAYDRDNENIASFEFTATDGNQTSDTAMVTIYVVPENTPPVASIASVEGFEIPHDGYPGTNTMEITLESTSTDADITNTGYDALTYEWVLVSGEDNIVDYDNVEITEPTLTFSAQVDFSNSPHSTFNYYEFKLVANDAYGASDTSAVIPVTVNQEQNILPTSVITSDSDGIYIGVNHYQIPHNGSPDDNEITVYLDGNDSYDGNPEDSIGYFWSSDNISINDSNSDSANFNVSNNFENSNVDYVINLQVTDSYSESGTSTETIIIEPEPNDAPFADATSTANFGEYLIDNESSVGNIYEFTIPHDCDPVTNSITINLDGSDTNDPDTSYYAPFQEDPLSYEWSCEGGDCAGISISQSGELNDYQASFEVSIPYSTIQDSMNFIIQLTVTDLYGASDTTGFEVKVNSEPNTPPVAVEEVSPEFGLYTIDDLDGSQDIYTYEIPHDGYLTTDSILVDLDGVNSEDVDTSEVVDESDSIEYEWSCSGDDCDEISLLNHTSMSSSFVVHNPYQDTTNTLQFNLTLAVTDPYGESNSKIFSVNVLSEQNTPPIAIVNEQDIYTYEIPHDGSPITDTLLISSINGLQSIDNDTSLDFEMGDTLSYEWELVNNENNEYFEIDDINQAEPTFTFTNPYTEADKEFQVILRVTDSYNVECEIPDTVDVTIQSEQNEQPVAYAEIQDNPQHILLIPQADYVQVREITLSGIQTTDAEGDSLRYIWTAEVLTDYSDTYISNIDSVDSPIISDLGVDRYRFILTVKDPYHESDSVWAESIYDTLDFRIVQPTIELNEDYRYSVNDANLTINVSYSENGPSVLKSGVEFYLDIPPGNAGFKFLYQDFGFEQDFVEVEYDTSNSSDTRLVFRVADSENYFSDGYEFDIEDIPVKVISETSSFPLLLNVSEIDIGDSNDNADLTENTISIGNPTLTYSTNYDQIFVLNDGPTYTLDNIIFTESSVPISSSDRGIDLIIPDAYNDIEWDTSNIEIVNGEIDNDNSTDKLIIIKPYEELDADSSIEISNLMINNQDETEFDSLFIEFKINDYDDVNDGWSSNSIRVGNPTIELSKDEIFVLGDLDYPNRIMTIDSLQYLESGNVGVANTQDSIKIIIPQESNLKFSETQSNIEMIISGNGGGDIGDFTINSKEIVFAVTNNFGKNDILTIKDIQVIPEGVVDTTCIILDASGGYGTPEDFVTEKHIRVGDPQILSVGPQVFIVGETSVDLLEKLIISEDSTVASINSNDDIRLVLPPDSNININWDVDVSSIVFQENSTWSKINTSEIEVSLSNTKILKIPITEDFIPGDSLIILSGLSIDLDNSSGGEILDTSNVIKLEVNGLYDGYEYKDYNPIIIASPTFEFNNTVGMVVNDPSIPIGITITDHSQYATIKKDEKIRIMIPDSLQNRIEFDTSSIPQFSSSNGDILIDNSNYQVYSDTVLLIPTDNFPNDYELYIDSLKFLPKDKKLINGNLIYTVRNYSEDSLYYQNSNNFQTDGGGYYIAKPEIYSKIKQKHYLQNNPSQLHPIIVYDDADNPVYKTLLDTIRIKLPDNVKWNVSDNIISQLGPNAGSVSSVVYFSPDSQLAKIVIQEEFSNPADSIEIAGLSILSLRQSEEIESVSFRLTNTENDNIIDDKIFVIGNIYYTSTNPNIIYKEGDDEELSDIVINDYTTIDDEKLTSIALYLPQNLNIAWSDSLLDLQNTSSVFVGNSDSVLENIDDKSLLGKDPNDSLKFVINFTAPLNDSFIISGLRIHNNTNLDMESKAKKIKLFVDNNNHYCILDQEFTFVTSCDVSSESNNRLLVNSNNDGKSTRKLNNVLIRNDSTLWSHSNIQNINKDDTFSLSIPGLRWNFEGDDNEPNVLNVNGVATETIVFLSDESDTFNLIFKPISDLEDNIFYLSNLNVDIASTDIGSRKAEITLIDRIIGRDKYYTIVGEPTISLDESYHIWVNSDRHRTINSLQVSQSEMQLLNEGFNIHLWSNNQLSEVISFTSNQNDSNFTVYDEGKSISIQDIDVGINQNRLITPINIKIDSVVYSNGYLSNHSLRLTLDDNYEDNFVETDEFEISPSFFFTEPVLYQQEKSGFTNELKTTIGFYYNESLQPYADINTLRFEVCDSILDLSGIVIDTSLVDEISVNDYTYYGLINVELTIIEDNIIELNRLLDEYRHTNVEVKLTQINRESNDKSDLHIWPFDNANNFIFIDSLRHINPTTTNISIHTQTELSQQPQICISPIGTPDCIYDVVDSLVSYSHPTISFDISESLFGAIGDGLKEVSLYYDSSESDTSSMKFSRIYYFDSEPPTILSYSPQDGLNPFGDGHDLSPNDFVQLTFIDGPWIYENGYFYDINNNYDPIIFSDTTVFDEDCLADISITVNGDLIDSLIFSNFVIDDDGNDLILIENENIEFNNKKGEIIYTFNISDPAGNTSEHELIYTLRNSTDSDFFFFNYPNPFSPLSSEKTHFRYTLTNAATWGKLMIFNNNGEIVYKENLTANLLTPETHIIEWDGHSQNGLTLSTGVYFSIIQFSNSINTRINKVAIIN